MIFGEIGNGKSTTGNMLIRELLSGQKEDSTNNQKFKAGSSTRAVTTKI
jgi:ABC-type oligopeptide transport system ATPase subunit